MSPVAPYRQTPAEMTAAAASIGCRLACPHITRHTILETDPDAVLVTNNSTETRWWQGIAQHSTAICFPLGRLRWKSTLQGQTVFYFGTAPDAFVAAFSPFGWTLRWGP